MQVACARNNASIGSACAAINDAAAGYSELHQRAACTISLTLAFFCQSRWYAPALASCLLQIHLGATGTCFHHCTWQAAHECIGAAQTAKKRPTSGSPSPGGSCPSSSNRATQESNSGIAPDLPVAARTELPALRYRFRYPPRAFTHLEEPCEHEYLNYTPARDGEGVVRRCNLGPPDVEEKKNMLGSRSAHSNDLP